MRWVSRSRCWGGVSLVAVVQRTGVQLQEPRISWLRGAPPRTRLNVGTPASVTRAVDLPAQEAGPTRQHGAGDDAEAVAVQAAQPGAGTGPEAFWCSCWKRQKRKHLVPSAATRKKAHCGDGVKPPVQHAVDWAALLQRVWGMDTLDCPKCDGKMTAKAIITDSEEAQRFLEPQGR